MINLISISGGKDSTAMALLAIERQTENLRFVFADTGHEHQQTYEYVRYLGEQLKRLCGVGIETVKADFSKRIEGKRKFIAENWEADGVPAERVQKALEILKPTGNPFLDLCLWKGRFPSTRRRFCSEELKHRPINEYIERLLPETIISWQGVRRDESRARRDLPERDVEFGSWEPEPSGHLIYRPILDWKAEDCFNQHRKFCIDWNPLYEQGMGRVGCMPCIHVTKGELLEIASRFSEELERVKEWEALVSTVAKRGESTFLDGRLAARLVGTGLDEISHKTHGIDVHVDWSKTARGGKQYDLIAAVQIEEPESCSSVYGLCE